MAGENAQLPCLEKLQAFAPRCGVIQAMKLSEMKQILAENDLPLSKSLGQNFLHDSNQLRRIAAAGELTASDRVLEIGPGLGPLTDLLLAQAGSVLAIEKDRRLVDVLSQRLQGTPDRISATASRRRIDSLRLMAATRAQGSEDSTHELKHLRNPPHSPGGEKGGHRPDEGEGSNPGAPIRFLLVQDDALEFLRCEPRDWSDWKMVSNLPYSVASPLLVELAQAVGCPERMVVTVQREVAQRIFARPGDKDYGLLTLLIQLRYQPRAWFKVPAGCFFPRPDVDSACVTLLRRSAPLLSREQAVVFTKVVKRAFSQRRKRMFKLLLSDWPLGRLTTAWEYLELPPDTRAERVSMEKLVALTNLLSPLENHGRRNL